MIHGPCGGVLADGRCEVAEHPCTFLDLPTVRYTGEVFPDVPRTAAADRMRERLDLGRVIVADLPDRALDAESTRAVARTLRGTVDAVLLGDAPDARVQFSPTYRAALVVGEGLAAWSGVNDRDRNRVAIEGELAGLADVGAAGVHCVTGDHPLAGDRPDAMPVFDLDATSTVPLALAAGHLVSVGETPAAPPVERRPERLLEKERAAATVCFVDHCGGPDAVARFVREARALGSVSRFVACVPFVVDVRSAALLGEFPGFLAPDGYLDRIVSAADALTAGIEAAVRLAEEMLGIPGVAGVDLSGGPGARGDHGSFADALAEAGTRIARS
jgi:5,10-methylenetetrahydrofolate reductase